jgi:hypothetical protein
LRPSVKSQVHLFVGVGSSHSISLLISCFLFSLLFPSGLDPESLESDPSLPPLPPLPSLPSLSSQAKSSSVGYPYLSRGLEIFPQSSQNIQVSTLPLVKIYANCFARRLEGRVKILEEKKFLRPFCHRLGMVIRKIFEIAPFTSLNCWEIDPIQIEAI